MQSSMLRSQTSKVGSRRAFGGARVKAAKSIAKAAPQAVTTAKYGEDVFRGAVADKYLQKHGLDASVLDTPEWTSKHADAVADAVSEWGQDRGATVFCHWFQPMGASGVRHGLSGQVHMNSLEFDEKGQPFYKIKGKDILKGETDGSSYPNGGMRATHTAGGYLALDPESPMFLRGDTIFIPACFVSYNGDALDEKTPLHRATQAMSREGKRLFDKLGYSIDGMVCNIGLEQEIFLVPREAYYNRPDLQAAGRTVMGKMPPRGQEMCDHYMSAMSSATPALACMTEIQNQCFKMGIPLKTRHREVAPNQYEFAPLFGTVCTQIDQNLMVMQIIEEVAAKYDMAALLQEKPFAGINGSGKHNNWSISTMDGAQLLNPDSLAKKSGNTGLFPIVLAALVSAIDKHGDLMRMAIASPGNDFRLGAMEAPPAVMSTYLGPDITAYLERYVEGSNEAYTPSTKDLSFGLEHVAPIEVPAEDRNRTSPFPYGGSRFEFRACGSSQNVSLVNTVLCAITAEAFKDIADRMDKGEKADDIARALLKEHSKCIFNGNGYDPSWPEEAVKKGVWRIDSGVDAIKRFSDQKNKDLFEKMGVFQAHECEAREEILLEHYIGTVEIEALAMKDMINQHVIPSCKAADVGPINKLKKSVNTLDDAVANINKAASTADSAALCRVLRLETMENIRALCDEAEALCPPHLWTLATYNELLFLDTQPL